MLNSLNTVQIIKNHNRLVPNLMFYGLKFKSLCGSGCERLRHPHKLCNRVVLKRNKFRVRCSDKTWLPPPPPHTLWLPPEAEPRINYPIMRSLIAAPRASFNPISNHRSALIQLFGEKPMGSTTSGGSSITAKRMKQTKCSRLKTRALASRWREWSD